MSFHHVKHSHHIHQQRQQAIKRGRNRSNNEKYTCEVRKATGKRNEATTTFGCNKNENSFVSTITQKATKIPLYITQWCGCCVSWDIVFSFLSRILSTVRDALCSLDSSVPPFLVWRSWVDASVGVSFAYPVLTVYFLLTPFQCKLHCFGSPRVVFFGVIHFVWLCFRFGVSLWLRILGDVSYRLCGIHCGYDVGLVSLPLFQLAGRVVWCWPLWLRLLSNRERLSQSHR